MTDFFEELGLDEPVVEATGVLVPPVPRPASPRRDRRIERRERAMERAKEAEERILHKSLDILQSALAAPTVSLAAHDPEDPEFLPPGWLEQHGGDVERAREAYRIALAAWAPSSKAPAWLKLASDQATGILAARARNKETAKVLNVQVVQIRMPAEHFPILDVEND